MKFKLILSLLLFISLYADIHSQIIPKNKYGLKIIDSMELYWETVAKDSNKLLVDLEKFIPGIKTDVKYATKDNFTKQVLYTQAKVYTRYHVARALKKIQSELKEKGFELLIFDGFRPYSVTEIMWANVLDDRYAADPKKGSRHNRGCAIDLTIVNSTTGEELEMPTPFDDFTIKAHHAYAKLPEHIIKNRALLKNIMIKHNFEPITSEWWHYDFKGWNSYELLNLSFEDLEEEKIK
jgi:zinc D-Ala-D-Ala dipeptidase